MRMLNYKYSEETEKKKNKNKTPDGVFMEVFIAEAKEFLLPTLFICKKSNSMA